MNSLQLLATSYLALLFSGQAMSHTVKFYVQNKCSFPIWPATPPNAGQPVIAGGGFFLAAGDMQRIEAPWTWSGRIWARTGCNFNFNSNGSNWRPTCETGDCDGRLKCSGLIGQPPVTLVQFTLQGGKQPDFYDVSVVDGYNLPVHLLSHPYSPKCSIGGCLKDVNKMCPEELQVVNKNCEVVACKSGCLAFNLDSFCCRDEFGTPENCRPNAYSRLFKEACPCYYSYSFDSPPPLVNCEANEYIITFCPSAWGEQHNYSMLHRCTI